MCLRRSVWIPVLWGQVIKVINKLPSIADNLRISIGAPNHAGIYSVTAVTDNKNYNTGVGAGALVLKADKGKACMEPEYRQKISAAEAAGADFGARLEIGGAAVADQSSVSVLYSGFTSKWKVYSSTTTPPTEPGALHDDRSRSRRQLPLPPRSTGRSRSQNKLRKKLETSTSLLQDQEREVLVLFTRTTSQSPRLRETLATVAITRRYMIWQLKQRM